MMIHTHIHVCASILLFFLKLEEKKMKTFVEKKNWLRKTPDKNKDTIFLRRYWQKKY